MKLIDPSQRINVLWDNDDGTRYTEEMTIRRLLAVMSDDEVETIELVRCEDCKWYRFTECRNDKGLVVACDDGYCKYGERRTGENG